MNSRNSRRDRRFSSDRRPSRRVSTQRLLLASTHPRSVCTPSTRDVPTPEPTTTERSCTKAAGRSSEPKPWRPCGRTSTKTGPRDPRPVFPSGSASAPARRLETQRPQKTKRVVRLLPQRKRKRRRRRKSKQNPYPDFRPLICLTFLTGLAVAPCHVTLSSQTKQLSCPKSLKSWLCILFLGLM